MGFPQPKDNKWVLVQRAFSKAKNDINLLETALREGDLYTADFLLSSIEQAITVVHQLVKEALETGGRYEWTVSTTAGSQQG